MGEQSFKVRVWSISQTSKAAHLGSPVIQVDTVGYRFGSKNQAVAAACHFVATNTWQGGYINEFEVDLVDMFLRGNINPPARLISSEQLTRQELNSALIFQKEQEIEMAREKLASLQKQYNELSN